LKWDKSANDLLVPLLYEHVFAFLGKQLLPQYGSIQLEGTAEACRELKVPYYTEYERNGFVYRAHPKYRGDYAYYDWAYIKWDDGLDEITGEPLYVSIIGHILCFFKHPDGSLMAVVQSCMWTTDEQHGVFGTYWHLEFEGSAERLRPKLEMVSVDSLQDHVCMIPYKEDDPFMWIHVWSCCEWANCFQTIEPPNDDNLRIRGYSL
jgi:hypothetical protein